MSSLKNECFFFAYLLFVAAAGPAAHVTWQAPCSQSHEGSAGFSVHCGFTGTRV